MRRIPDLTRTSRDFRVVPNCDIYGPLASIGPEANQIGCVPPLM
jgi:hypothetical protein